MPQPLETDMSYAALPSLSLVKSFHDLASSRRSWDTRPADTLNRLATSLVVQWFRGRVALGGCPPTDPYMHALEHTAPQAMVSLLDV